MVKKNFLFVINDTYFWCFFITVKKGSIFCKYEEKK